MKKVIVFSLAGISLLLMKIGNAEDLDKIFDRVNDYVAKENYTKALKELSWARKELEKLNFKKLAAYFPDNLSGFTGGEINAQAAMGITAVSRDYTKDDRQVKVSLSGGGAMGSMAAMSQMALMFQGNSPGMDSYRIEGRTAMLEEKPKRNRASLTVMLESGSILKFEMKRKADGGALRTMGEEFKIVDLDNYLKGQVK